MTSPFLLSLTGPWLQTLHTLDFRWNIIVMEVVLHRFSCVKGARNPPMRGLETTGRKEEERRDQGNLHFLLTAVRL